MDDEKYEAVLRELGDDGVLLTYLKAIYDWSVLCDLLKGKDYISEAKVAVYDQHKADLVFLKKFIRKYIPGQYNKVFRNIEAGNYVSYSGNTKSVKSDISSLKKTNDIKVFGKFFRCRSKGHLIHTKSFIF